MEDTVAQNRQDSSNNNQSNNNKTVNLIETGEIFGVEKRDRKEADIVSSDGPTLKRNKSVMVNQSQQSKVVGDDGVVIQEQEKNKTKVKKTRHPPRKLPVHISRRDIWQRLMNLDSGLSVAEWMALDKTAYQDVRDGLRYLHSRRSNRKRTQAVNAVEIAQDTDDSWSEVDSEKEDWSSNESVMASDESDYLSDDTIYDYPYDLKAMERSVPLRGPVVINGILVRAVFDSGASVSVISKSLAEKLGLLPNGDKLPLSTMDDGSRRSCDVVVSVPIRVAGKLRPEHMCIQSNTDRDICLLGVTWFKAYGIQARPKDETIVIPTKHGTGFVELHCQTHVNDIDDASVSHVTSDPQIGEILAVSVRTDDVAEDSDPTLEKYHELLSTGNISDDDDQESSELPPEINNLLECHRHCFYEEVGLGKVTVAQHHIHLTADTPIRSKPYRLSWEEDKHLKEEIDKLLSLGLIRPSQGKWSSPVFFVKKKDGSLRLVIDYRRLNKLTVKDSFPLPHIDDLLDSLGGARWFSTLDAASGYWQVPLADDAIEKTGFVCKYGTYEWLVTPFGLTTAGETYQRMMSTILAPFIGEFVYVFIDDVIVWSRTLEEHVEHLRKVFEVCNSVNLRLRRDKCSLARRQVEYLGHIVSAEGLRPGARNVEKLLAMRKPNNTSDVRSFLGMTGYFRRFIPDYATVAEPLTKLLKKEATFVWEEEQALAFEKLKVVLTSPPILAFPDSDKLQILTTDASGRGIGAVLSQVQDEDSNDEQVVAYASRVLRGSELKYSITHMEALAVVWGVRKFRHYLAGRKFIIRTDHSALSFIFNNPTPSPKVQRWSAALFEYDFKVQYRPGRMNTADPLSRLLPSEH